MSKVEDLVSRYINLLKEERIEFVSQVLEEDLLSKVSTEEDGVTRQMAVVALLKSSIEGDEIVYNALDQIAFLLTERTTNEESINSIIDRIFPMTPESDYHKIVDHKLLELAVYAVCNNDKEKDLTHLQLLVIWVLWKLSRISEQHKTVISEMASIPRLVIRSFESITDNATQFKDLIQIMKISQLHILELFELLKKTSDHRYLEILSALLDKQYDSHFKFQNASFSYRTTPKVLKNSYTAQLWVKFNSFMESEIFTINGKLSLKLESSKLAVHYKHQLTGIFDTYQFEDSDYYHIVLIHESSNQSNPSQSSRAKLHLYVNGTYIQHLRCPLPFQMDDEFQESNELVLKIAGNHDTDIDVSNFTFIAGSQSFEWVLLSYFLGRNYSGNYQDPQIFKCLNYEDRSQFNLRLLDSTNNRKDENDINNLSIVIPRDTLILNFNEGFFKSSSEVLIENHIAKTKPDLKMPHVTILGTVFHYQYETASELFYSVSGLRLTLSLIEESKDIHSLQRLIEFFFKMININWKFIQETESNNYFNILSRLLRFKKVQFDQNLSLELFDTVLGFVGYNFQSPFNSVINNHLAYDIFIFDFQLWRPLSTSGSPTKFEDTEILRFLLFQITVFSRECKYANFNALKLKKLKIIKKFLNALSQGIFPAKLNDIIFDSLLTLVKGNLTPEVVYSLSSFVIFSLNEKSNDTGLLVLRALADVFLDPLISSTAYWKKLFASCSIKWILLLLDLGKDVKLVFDIGLSFIIKIFTISRRTYDLFIKNNGLSALLNILRGVKFDEVEINLLIKGSFAQYQYNQNFEKLYHPIEKDSLTSVEFHELNYLILDALEWTVLNDIFTVGGHEKIIRMLNMYSSFVHVAVQENSSFQKILESDMIYIKKICNMILLLTKPTNASMYFESCQRYVAILSNIIITKLFNVDTHTLENYLLALLKDEYNPDTQIDSVSTVFVSLIFPQVLIHLKGFSTEFHVLLKTNGIKFSNIAVFLGALHNELLSFEWNSKDYLNYLSVLLDIIEAYKQSRKSLRNSYYIQLVKSITSVMNALICVLRYSTSTEQKENFLKVLMFHQENLFNKENLTNDGVSNLISLLLQIGTKSDPLLTNLSFNCLRMILMHRQDDSAAICSCITFRSFLPVTKFLHSVTSSSDEDVVANYLFEGKIKDVFGKHLEALTSKVDKRYNRSTFISSEKKINDLILRFDNSVKTKYELLDAVSKTFKDDNESLRLKIVSNETMKIARYVQDQQDNLQFYLLEYRRFRAEAEKIAVLQSGKDDPTTKWTLDNMEGIDRMRKILSPYDDIEIDNNLFTVVNIPVKKVDKVNPEERAKIETQSLKSFEFIEPDVVDDSLNTYNDRNRKVLKCLFPGDKIQQLWNVSQVVGLDIIEGVLILGEMHLYIIQNYFHKAQNDEIIDIDEASDEERDPNIKLITGQPTAKLKETSKGPTNRHSVQTWDIFKLTSVTKRRFLLRDVALELFFSNGGSFLITSVKTKDRDVIFSKLSSVATNSNIDNDLSNIFKETNLINTSFGSTGRNFTTKLAIVFGAEYLNYLDATKKWQNGEMSNFYYLMIVNTFAGRTFNDLTQYPVFPWVIADYTSEELDLNDPKSFRDLSKPMGAQSPVRARQFQERYEALQSLADEEAPPFHYGTHYSSAMIVASFLIRLEPFVQSYLLLQGGKFDHPDRLFNSIQKAWKSASEANTTDVRELIPEFYFLPEFLENVNKYEFGKLQDGNDVWDVELPRWAKGDPKIFIAKNREALESPYVSEHLHKWIDLIFGYKQTGPEAVESLNVFNHLSYLGAIDLDSINNEDERRSITGIIHNFGQTPTQIFNKPHPERDINVVLSVDPNSIKKNPTLIYQTKFKEPIQCLHFKPHSDSGDAFWRGYPALYLNGDIEVKRCFDTGPGSLIINRQTFERLHDDQITTLAKLDHETLLTGSESGVIHVWKYLVVVKGFTENLEFETRLRAHTSAIKELKVSPEFNLLLSLDNSGDCYIWDLSRYKLIRKISNTGVKFEHVAIAYDSGIIAASYGSSVSLFNVNGCLIYTGSISDDDSTITALNFANSRTVSTIRLNNLESHEVWKYLALLTTGWSNGSIRLYELKVASRSESERNWSLQVLKTLKFYDGKVNLAKDEVTVVESYLKSYFNYEEEKVGKIEIVAGDINGRVAVWRQ